MDEMAFPNLGEYSELDVLHKSDVKTVFPSSLLAYSICRISDSIPGTQVCSPLSTEQKHHPILQ
jgi:hypothetical protein